MRDLGQADLRKGAVACDLLRFEPAEERAQRRERAGERAARDPIATACRHERANALGIHVREISDARRVSKITAEPGEKLAQVALVGCGRVIRRITRMGKMVEPCMRSRAQVLRKRQAIVGQNLVERRR